MFFLLFVSEFLLLELRRRRLTHSVAFLVAQLRLLLLSLLLERLACRDVDKLKEELKKLYKKDIQINIFEVKKPELDATIVGKNIASQIEHMIAYRSAIKMAVANTMRAGAEGIKIQITGRLNGAEMARKEMFKEGRTPLHTFRADIDYCQAEALTKVGLLGIKVWICRGEVYGKADLTPNFSQDNKSNNRGNGRSNNRGGNRKRNNNR